MCLLAKDKCISVISWLACAPVENTSHTLLYYSIYSRTLKKMNMWLFSHGVFHTEDKNNVEFQGSGAGYRLTFFFFSSHAERTLRNRMWGSSNPSENSIQPPSCHDGPCSSGFAYGSNYTVLACPLEQWRSTKTSFRWYNTQVVTSVFSWAVMKNSHHVPDGFNGLVKKQPREKQD